ncbi:hypothetical protein HDU85_007147 [Gaertneriomyces sp. JEL0708]|nr:hypothetical protein HDU85_007147 [Gaertneriomyces sp. JEL0708]
MSTESAPHPQNTTKGVRRSTRQVNTPNYKMVDDAEDLDYANIADRELSAKATIAGWSSGTLTRRRSSGEPIKRVAEPIRRNSEQEQWEASGDATRKRKSEDDDADNARDSSRSSYANGIQMESEFEHGAYEVDDRRLSGGRSSKRQKTKETDLPDLDMDINGSTNSQPASPTPDTPNISPTNAHSSHLALPYGDSDIRAQKRASRAGRVSPTSTSAQVSATASPTRSKPAGRVLGRNKTRSAATNNDSTITTTTRRTRRSTAAASSAAAAAKPATLKPPRARPSVSYLREGILSDLYTGMEQDRPQGPRTVAEVEMDYVMPFNEIFTDGDSRPTLHRKQILRFAKSDMQKIYASRGKVKTLRDRRIQLELEAIDIEEEQIRRGTHPCFVELDEKYDERHQHNANKLRLEIEAAKTALDGVIDQANQDFVIRRGDWRRKLIEEIQRDMRQLQYEKRKFDEMSICPHEETPATTLVKRKRIEIEEIMHSVTGLPPYAMYRYPSYAQNMLRENKRRGGRVIAPPRICDGLNQSEIDQDMEFIRAYKGALLPSDIGQLPAIEPISSQS